MSIDPNRDAPRWETLSVHAGVGGDPRTGAVVFPIYQTSTFEQEEPGANPAWCYSRTGNPSRAALECALADLEGARHGLAFASGLAAAHALLSTLSAGDRVVAGAGLYGGSYRLFTKVFARFGVEFAFVDPSDEDALRAALLPRTKLLWLESPTNPLLEVTDLAAACALARERGARTVVDNTFATPYLQRPLALGADVVLHSTTKYLNGHSDVLGGALLTNDDALFAELKFLQNALGAVPGPQDCFLVLRGLRTLALRMDRHCANARRVAEFLAGHPAVERVHFPGLPGHPGHDVAKRQQRDFGGVVSFEVAGGEPAARRVLAGLRLFALAESLGGVRSLVCHPPTMTHASVEPEVRRACGIGDGLLRLSVGCEAAEDLVEDLRRALSVAGLREREDEPVGVGDVGGEVAPGALRRG